MEPASAPTPKPTVTADNVTVVLDTSTVEDGRLRGRVVVQM
jgi:hypothetical protein